MLEDICPPICPMPDEVVEPDEELIPVEGLVPDDELMPGEELIPEDWLALGVSLVVEDLLPLVADSAKAGWIATDSTAMLLQRTTGIMVFLYMVTSI